MFGDDAADPGRLRIKICGITNPEDAHVATELGADSLGFNGYSNSKRHLNIEEAADWISRIPDHVTKVAVLVSPCLEDAVRIASLPCISGLQLHGSETPEFCARLREEGVRFAKALPVVEGGSLSDLPFFATDLFVLDSASAGSFGGTGKTFSWALARRFIEAHPHHRVILAGGLRPENVARAVREVRPFGVDVTTGVESSPGRKDHARLRAFIEAARGASI